MLHTAAHPVSGLQAEVHPAVFLTQARHWAALKLVSQQTLQTPVAVHFPSVPGAQAVPPSLPFTAGLRQLSRKPCVACSKSNVLRHPTMLHFIKVLAGFDLEPATREGKIRIHVQS